MDLSVDKKFKSQKRRSLFDLSIRVTDRDLKVLLFCLEMKFGSFDELFERFFKTTLSGQQATTTEFMRRRLNELVANGLLAKQKTFNDRMRFYVSTKLGYELLKLSYPFRDFVKPTLYLDWNTVPHDAAVAVARRKLESRFEITEWISDRMLKSRWGKEFGFDRSFVPDGVFQLMSGEWIAFEYERQRKSRPAYREKLVRLAKVLREGRWHTRTISRVLIQTPNEKVYRLLKPEVAIWNGIEIELDLEMKSPPPLVEDSDC